MMKKQQNPFTSEQLRAKLAKDGRYDQLSKMYTSSVPQIPDKNTPTLWDKLNLDHKPKIIKNPMENDRLKTVASQIKGHDLNILNIGFGSGNLESIYFKEHPDLFANWHGIDISHASVKKVQKQYPKGNFTVGDILNLKNHKEYYDYVIALEVLEHIPPVKTLKAIAEIRKVLKPGGYFILSVPLNEGLEDMISKGENPNAHVRVYTPELIVGELVIAGFRVINEKKLFAFHAMYTLKSFIANYCLQKRWQPNNIIVLAKKPLDTSML